jgi:hypothetical protein
MTGPAAREGTGGGSRGRFPGTPPAAPCIRPARALHCEHMFVAAHRPFERGAKDPWI